LGYSLAWNIKKEDLLERVLMRIGLGICAFMLLIYVFGVLKIGLNVYYFLAMSLIVPVYRFFYLLKDNKSFFPKIDLSSFVLRRKHVLLFLLALVFFVTLYMYMKGSFAYPYLEDGDPYWHADAATYVSVRQTFVPPQGTTFNYLLPYPPAYSSFMGVLLQTNGDVVWTLKFFNALILSLSVLWFFFFARYFTGSGTLALFSTFMLASLPAYLSHFIFAHSLGAGLFAVGLYFVLKSNESNSWILPAIFAIAGLLVIQATVSVVFGIFSGVLFVGVCVQQRKIAWRTLGCLFSGLVFALGIFWIPNILASGGFSKIVTSGGGERLWAIGLQESSNQYLFSMNDFLITHLDGGIDTQIGVGLIACILVFFGVLYFIANVILSKKARESLVGDNIWVTVSFILLLISFLGIHGGRLPVRLVPIRWWAFFAISFAIFSAYSLSGLLRLVKRDSVKYFLVAFLIFGVVATSFVSRYSVQTALWPPHVWTSIDELKGYLQVKDTGYDGILPLCSHDMKLHFIGKRSYLTNPPDYDSGYFTFKGAAFNKSPEDISGFLHRNNLGYVLVDAACASKFGVNETNAKLVELSHSLKPVFQGPAVFLFEV
jgi:hypothetical protein